MIHPSDIDPPEPYDRDRIAEMHEEAMLDTLERRADLRAEGFWND